MSSISDVTSGATIPAGWGLADIQASQQATAQALQAAKDAYNTAKTNYITQKAATASAASNVASDPDTYNIAKTLLDSLKRDLETAMDNLFQAATNAATADARLELWTTSHAETSTSLTTGFLQPPQQTSPYVGWEPTTLTTEEATAGSDDQRLLQARSTALNTAYKNYRYAEWALNQVRVAAEKAQLAYESVEIANIAGEASAADLATADRNRTDAQNMVSSQAATTESAKTTLQSAMEAYKTTYGSLPTWLVNIINRAASSRTTAILAEETEAGHLFELSLQQQASQALADTSLSQATSAFEASRRLSSGLVDFSSITIPRGRDATISAMMKMLGDLKVLMQQLQQLLQSSDIENRLRLSSLSQANFSYYIEALEQQTQESINRANQERLNGIITLYNTYRTYQSTINAIIDEANQENYTIGEGVTTLASIQKLIEDQMTSALQAVSSDYPNAHNIMDIFQEETPYSAYPLSAPAITPPSQYSQITLPQLSFGMPPSVDDTTSIHAMNAAIKQLDMTIAPLKEQIQAALTAQHIHLSLEPPLTGFAKTPYIPPDPEKFNIIVSTFSTLLEPIGFLLIAALMDIERAQDMKQASSAMARLFGAYGEHLSSIPKNQPAASQLAKKIISSTALNATDIIQNPTLLTVLLAQISLDQEFLNSMKRQIEMMSLLAGIEEGGALPTALIKALIEGKAQGTLSTGEIDLLNKLVEKSISVNLADNLIQKILSLADNQDALRQMALAVYSQNLDKFPKLSAKELEKLLSLLQEMERFFFLLIASLLASVVGDVSATELLSGDAVSTLASQLTNMGMLPDTANTLASLIAPHFAPLFTALQSAGLTGEQAIGALVMITAPSQGIASNQVGITGSYFPAALLDLLKEGGVIPREETPTSHTLYQGLHDLILTKVQNEEAKKAALDALEQLVHPTVTGAQFLPVEAQPTFNPEEVYQQLVQSVEGQQQVYSPIPQTGLLAKFTPLLPSLLQAGFSTEQAMALLLLLNQKALKTTKEALDQTGVDFNSSLLDLLIQGSILPPTQKGEDVAGLYQNIESYLTAHIANPVMRNDLLSSMKALTSEEAPLELPTLSPPMLPTGTDLSSMFATLVLEAQTPIVPALTPSIRPILSRFASAGLNGEQSIAALLVFNAKAMGITEEQLGSTGRTFTKFLAHTLQTAGIVAPGGEKDTQGLFQATQSYLESHLADKAARKELLSFIQSLMSDKATPLAPITPPTGTVTTRSLNSLFTGLVSQAQSTQPPPLQPTLSPILGSLTRAGLSADLTAAMLFLFNSPALEVSSQQRGQTGTEFIAFLANKMKAGGIVPANTPEEIQPLVQAVQSFLTSQMGDPAERKALLSSLQSLTSPQAPPILGLPPSDATLSSLKRAFASFSQQVASTSLPLTHTSTPTTLQAKAFQNAVESLRTQSPAIPPTVQMKPILEDYRTLPPAIRDKLEVALPTSILQRYNALSKETIAAVLHAKQGGFLSMTSAAVLLQSLQQELTQGVLSALQQQNRLVHSLFTPSEEEKRIAEENKWREINQFKLRQALTRPSTLPKGTREQVRDHIERFARETSSLFHSKKMVETLLDMKKDKRMSSLFVFSVYYFLNPAKKLSLGWSLPYSSLLRMPGAAQQTMTL